jgi:beta-ketoacyl-acyl-carrier-protein synthase II
VNPGVENKNQVVITGLGVSSCLGSDLEGFWDSLLAGESGIRPVTLLDASDLPCKIAGEVVDFDPAPHLDTKQRRRMSRVSQMALITVKRALQDAGLAIPLEDSQRAGVSFGTAIGGFEKAEDGLYSFWEHGAARVNPFTLPAILPNMIAFHISEQFGAVGPSCTVTTACATGTQAVGIGADMVRSGRADVVICGGAEAMLREYTMAGFAAMRALPLNYNDAPEKASRPFDQDREGFVFSEGAACLILENEAYARQRGAHIYAAVGGYATSSDGYHMAALDPSGDGALRTMDWALEDAGIVPGEVDYINAHGTSTPINDAVETTAIKRLFGDRAYEIPISSTKSMIGHAMGASGALEALVCALTIERNWIHPTINLERPDPECDLDYVPNQPRQAAVSTALSNSFGLGAQNACLVLRETEPR